MAGGACLPGGNGPLLAAARALREGRTTSAALIERSLAAIERWGPPTNGVVTVLDDAAARQAASLDAEARGGHWRSPLHGIPVTVKDNIHVAGTPTLAGSAAYRRDPTEDAVAVARLRAAGAVVVAKVATHEFALGVTTPQARHPLDATRIPGGSSGGGGISVATGMALASLATDTRASIRVPASLCGVVGFKPTLGAVPAEGIVWLSWTMDHVGVLAGSAADAGCVVDVLSAGALALRHGPAPVAGMRVGVPRCAFDGAEPSVTAAVRAAMDRLAALGVALVDVDEPTEEDFCLANSAGLVVSRCEALEYHRSLGTDWSLLWPETRAQFEAAASLGAGEYLRAQRYRSDLAARLLALVERERFAALAMPSTLVHAPPVEEAERNFTRLSTTAIPWSLVGWPSLSVPAPVPAGSLPVGLQLVAPPYEDATVVSLGAACGA